MQNKLRFLRGFVRNPREVGSIVPSSRALSRAVASHVPAQARVVAELGPGTGPITRALLERLGSGATVIALEIDRSFCDALRQSLPDERLRVVQAPAQELSVRAAALGFNHVDAVVSGLPFANFPPVLREEIVRAAHGALKPGGIFAGYGYAPFALPRVLRGVFGECRYGYVWRNVPPAFVFTARKAVREGGLD